MSRPTHVPPVEQSLRELALTFNNTMTRLGLPLRAEIDGLRVTINREVEISLMGATGGTRMWRSTYNGKTMFAVCPENMLDYIVQDLVRWYATPIVRHAHATAIATIAEEVRL
jgi:hypothetical protein